MDKLFTNTPACEKEQELNVIGKLPEWIEGDLYRLGPGLFDLDTNFTLNHWFDGAAILFRFNFTPDRVKCRSSFLKTDAYTKMMTVKRPVYTEFGTPAYPDTSKSMFSRFFSQLVPSELTDNVHGNIYAIGNDLYCASETCNIWRINPETLAAESKVDLSKIISVHLASSHPHVEPDGTIINLGSSFLTGLKHHFFKIYPENEKVNNNNTPSPSANRKSKGTGHNFPTTKTIATLSSSWSTMFSFTHSFSVTKNYIIFIEQPMLINMLKLVTIVVKQNPLREAFEWAGREKKTRFRVIDKETGHVLPYSFYGPAFFFLHTINAFEDGKHIVIDLVAYDNADVLDSFYVKKLRQPDREENKCQPSIRRFVLPLVENEVIQSNNRKLYQDNLTTLHYTTSRSIKIDSQGISVYPEYLLDPGFEIPSINRKFDGRDYQFVYGSGLFEKNMFQNSLVKFDVKSKLKRTWVGTSKQFTGEAVFIPKPHGREEDDGLLMSTISELEPGKQHFLLVLNANDLKEVARIEMGTVTLCPTVHGLWVPLKKDSDQESKRQQQTK